MSTQEANTSDLQFHSPSPCLVLSDISRESLDAAPFGIIEFNRSGVISRYNKYEQELAGLSEKQVLGRDFFTDVAPCTNNYIVREQYVEAWEGGSDLDETIDYIFSYKMTPTRVRLRLLVSGDKSWLLVLKVQEQPGSQ